MGGPGRSQWEDEGWVETGGRWGVSQDQGEVQGGRVTGGVEGGGVPEAPPATAFGSEWRFWAERWQVWGFAQSCLVLCTSTGFPVCGHDKYPGSKGLHSSLTLYFTPLAWARERIFFSKSWATSRCLLPIATLFPRKVFFVFLKTSSHSMVALLPPWCVFAVFQLC